MSFWLPLGIGLLAYGSENESNRKHKEKQHRKRRIEKLKDRLQDIDLKLLEQEKGSIKYLKLFKIKLEIQDEIKAIQNEMVAQKEKDLKASKDIIKIVLGLFLFVIVAVGVMVLFFWGYGLI